MRATFTSRVIRGGGIAVKSKAETDAIVCVIQLFEGRFQAFRPVVAYRLARRYVERGGAA